MSKNKYEPQSVSEIIFSNDESRQLIVDIVSGAVPFPNAGTTGILLYGIYGTGKTTLANLLPKAIEQGQTGHSLGMPEEFFACQFGHAGTAIIDLVRKQTDVRCLNESGNHYYIFDEVDSLSKSAQRSLKSTLNSRRATFILTTNNFRLVEAGVRDRCHCIPFNAAPAPRWLPLCRRILADAGVTGVSDQALINVIASGNGSARNILDAVISVVIKVRRQSAAQAAVVEHDTYKQKPARRWLFAICCSSQCRSVYAFALSDTRRLRRAT